MLSYHPALDPYHAAFRVLRILMFDPSARYEREKLFILDFYVAFPQLIAEIRLPPQETGRRRRFSVYANEYVFSGTPKLIFLQMRLLQETALRLLFSKGLIDGELYSNDLVQVRVEALPDELAERIRQKNVEDPELMRYITAVLGAFSLHGVSGLKDRTGLLEFRYDAA